MRKEVIINIVDDGSEVTFKIKQMPATKGERWTNRVLTLLASSDNVSSINMKDIQNLSNKNADNETSSMFTKILQVVGKLDYEKLEPLYNELIECCEHIPDKNTPNFTVPCNQSNIDTIIGDFRTLYKLRIEALKVNYDFFQLGQTAQNSQPLNAVIFQKRTKI